MDIILVPGLWLDGSSWDRVVPGLSAAGHRAHPLTLPGMESRDLDRAGIGLRDHVAAVVAAIDACEPNTQSHHVDIFVPHDIADARVAAGLAGGGHLITDAHAPAWWVLADPEGNEACVGTWKGRD